MLPESYRNEVARIRTVFHIWPALPFLLWHRFFRLSD
jgi:hypothetical protein